MKRSTESVKEQNRTEDLVVRLGDELRQFFVDPTEERSTAIQNLLRGLYSDLLALESEPLSRPIELLMARVQRVLFELEDKAGRDYEKNPLFHLGRLSAVAELGEVMRHKFVPYEATKVLVSSQVARQIAYVILENRSLSPSEIARLCGKESQNLVPILRKMVVAGILYAQRLGHRVRYSPTDLAQHALENARPYDRRNPESHFWDKAGVLPAPAKDVGSRVPSTYQEVLAASEPKPAPARVLARAE
jgi:DNA-binding MarR family transcriptional regulator